jgi:hypothetical protein
MRMKINWDAMGIGTSIACAIHCAFLPLFLNSLPLFGINLIDHLGFEIFMIVLAFVIGAYSLYHGYLKHHHSFLPLIIFCCGFAFLVLKQFFVQYETWLLIPAVIGIIAAHVMNYRSCRVHDHAHREDCDH